MKFSDDAVLQAAAMIVAAQITRDDMSAERILGPEISELLYQAVAAVRAVDFALVDDRSSKSHATWKKLAEDIPR